jgi:hypothetical protein
MLDCKRTITALKTMCGTRSVVQAKPSVSPALAAATEPSAVRLPGNASSVCTDPKCGLGGPRAHDQRRVQCSWLAPAR